jgi:hypothetical protein
MGSSHPLSFLLLPHRASRIKFPSDWYAPPYRFLLSSRSPIPSLVNKAAPIANQVAPILSPHKAASSTRSPNKRTLQGFMPFCGHPIVLPTTSPTAYHVVWRAIVWPFRVECRVGVCRFASRRRRRRRRGKSFVSICPREDPGMLAGLGRREVPSLHRFGRQGEDGVISSSGLRRYRGLRLFGCCSQRVTGGCKGLFGGNALRWKRQPLFPLTCPFLVHVRICSLQADYGSRESKMFCHLK